MLVGACQSLTRFLKTLNRFLAGKGVIIVFCDLNSHSSTVLMNAV